MSSIAKRLNNPLNIRPGQPYEGLADPAQVAGFCNFSSPVWGFRAVFRNYITKADRGVNTITKLISEWAPTTENDTAVYIATVAKASGYGADEPINLKAWDTASKVCYAQAEVESGQPFEANWTQAQMAEGAFRAGITDAPQPVAHKVAVLVSGAAAATSSAAPAAIDAINTYKPLIDQSHSHTLKTLFALLAGAFAVLAVYHAVRSK